MNTKVMFSSNSDEWETPQWLFNELAKEFEYDQDSTLDVCALPENAKTSRFYTPDQDGLKQPWKGKCWMNPPYGREIGKWVKKAYEESQKGAMVVCLLPARTDTKWFHEYCTKGDIRFLKGRLKFGGSKNSAPFPSMITIFKCKEGHNDI